MNKNKFKKFDIASRVLSHGSDNIEVKLEYNLADLVKTNNYKIETYFFVPSELKVDKSTYPKENFYFDTKNYLRFMTPYYSLRQIIDPKFSKSPLNILKQILKNYDKAKPAQKKQYQDQIIKELKLTGTMVRARLRDWRNYVKQGLFKNKFDSKESITDFKERLTNCQSYLISFRKLEKVFLKKIKDQNVIEYFKIVEEFTSNLIEERLAQVMSLIEPKIKKDQQEKLKKIKSELAAFLKIEKSLRQRKKFKLKFENTKKGKEKYLYYFNQYKKAVASVLYLDITRKKSKTPYIHVIAAWAAFFTAGLNSYISFFIIKKYYATNTIILVVLMALLYVFKDRLKNLLKIIAGKQTLSRFPDFSTKIRDKVDKKKINLGEIREKVFFPTEEQSSQTVLNIKNKAKSVPQNKLENIMVYQKEMNIKTSLIKKYYERTTNLTDIMRFNISKFFINMAEPKKSIYYLDEALKKVVATFGKRVYHIGLIIKYTKFTSRRKKVLHYEYYKVVCTKAGIERVDFIDKV